LSSAGGLVLDPKAWFLEGGFLSLTTICSLGLACLLTLAALLRVRDITASDWRRAFFTINCCAFPAWIIFYRMMAGNLSEFRMLFPVLMPGIYGIAYASLARGAGDRPQSGT